ncbi:GGDEF/response regulator receiver domain protein (plasmid) [Acidisarcina polymorpha]|uniref:diguanylate cyclase n=1 Tax=Acidisarcina polymorpha TaxID=2211140 RepID=A0A2Z5GBT5_9BACT|nr:GGDEF/response regulator receiver domain protein [Acidisarcina polymorpha]
MPLTSVSQIRGLSQERAAKGMPVKLTGIVTNLSGYKNSFFFQDSTAGISVDRTDHADVGVGDLVVLTGTSSAGLFAPTVVASYVRVVGHEPLPRARRVGYAELIGGVLDSQRIEVRGVVRSAHMSQVFDHDILVLVVELGGGSIRGVVQNLAGINYNPLVDSTVSIRGVCTSHFNEKRQFIGAELYVSDGRGITVVQPAAADPFALSAIPVRNVLQFGQGQHRVKIEGIATHQIPGHALYLQDGSDGVRIQTSSKELVESGNRVEAVGFPVQGEYSPILEDGLFHVVGKATPIVPLLIKAKDAIGGRSGFDQVPYDQQLVKLQGKVVDSWIQGGQHVWILQQGSEVFDAYLPMITTNERTRTIGVGSVLMMTGICTVHADHEGIPTSFSILLRSPQDILVLKQAPFWTPTRILLLLAALAGVTLLAILWILMLRVRVKRQTRIIRESEERFRHLAQHDELTGMWNRSAILSALDRETDRCRRENRTMTIVLADIDHFKRVNDTYGHLAGDTALRRFATALSGCVRSYDHAGRYGGEEFLIVLTGILAGDLDERMAALHASISDLEVEDVEVTFRITCSIGGVFIAAGDEIDQHSAMRMADQALYRAKNAGRHRVVYQMFQRETSEEPLLER